MASFSFVCYEIKYVHSSLKICYGDLMINSMKPEVLWKSNDQTIQIQRLVWKSRNQILQIQRLFWISKNQTIQIQNLVWKSTNWICVHRGLNGLFVYDWRMVNLMATTQVMKIGMKHNNLKMLLCKKHR
jgi:hypothetical protein